MRCIFRLRRRHFHQALWQRLPTLQAPAVKTVDRKVVRFLAAPLLVKEHQHSQGLLQHQQRSRQQPHGMLVIAEIGRREKEKVSTCLSPFIYG